MKTILARPAVTEPLEARITPALLISLHALDGTDGFRVVGDDFADSSGFSVSDAGDVNGDGFEDVIIGAPRADRGGQPPAAREVIGNGEQPQPGENAGESYVVFGKVGGFDPDIDLGALDGTDGFRLLGIDTGDFSGFSVSGAGDVNGDGFDDVVVGAYGGDPDGAFGAGECYVVLGHAGAFAPSLDLGTLTGSNGFRLDGIANNGNVGVAVSGAGDVNGDGLADLLVGAPGATLDGENFVGQSFVVFGQPGGFAPSLDLASLNGTTGFRIDGFDVYDIAGRAVSGLGDINGDGFGDLGIGAPGAKGNRFGGVGEAYVILGKRTGWTPTFDLGTLDGTNGFVIAGVGPDSSTGFSIGGAGDVNGDGLDDVIVGAPSAGGDGPQIPGSGEAYVIFGQTAVFPAVLSVGALDGTNGFTLRGEEGSDAFGISVGGAGDMNGDGFDDVIVGAYYATTDREYGISAGKAYVIFGHGGPFEANRSVTELTDDEGIVFEGAFGYDYTGISVLTGGDMNGDGFDDVIIGAFYADPYERFNAGASYVVFGFDTGGVTLAGDETANLLNGTGLADVIVAGQNDDTVVLPFAEGRSDVVHAGEGDDTIGVAAQSFRRLDGGRGFDTLRFDTSANVFSILGDAGHELTGLERIDLGPGNNSLTVDRLSVLNLSDSSNTLIVLRNGQASNTVAMGDGWTPAAQEVIEGRTFDVFVQGQAFLKIEAIRAAGDGLIAVSVERGKQPLVRVFDGAGNPLHAFLAYEATFKGGVRVAMADVTGDGIAEVITAAGGTRGGGRLRAFDALTGAQVALGGSLDDWTLFGARTHGRASFTTADLTGDGIAEIITGSARRGPSVIAYDGSDRTKLFEFKPFTSNYVNGINIAVGDVNNDGTPDLVAAEAHTRGPAQVKVFDGSDPTHIIHDFVVTGSNRGVTVAVGYVNNDGYADIVTGSAREGGSGVTVFSGLDASVLSSFTPYGTFTHEIRVAVADLNGDGLAEIITTHSYAKNMQLRAFSLPAGLPNFSVTAFPEFRLVGAYVAAAEYDADGGDEDPR